MNAVAEKKVSTNSRTEYKLVGELTGVLKAIHAIFMEHDPRGYGTWVRRITHQDGDLYAAEVERANSCD